jgi:hypothetical protein
VDVFCSRAYPKLHCPRPPESYGRHWLIRGAVQETEVPNWAFAIPYQKKWAWIFVRSLARFYVMITWHFKHRTEQLLVKWTWMQYTFPPLIPVLAYTCILQGAHNLSLALWPRRVFRTLSSNKHCMFPLLLCPYLDITRFTTGMSLIRTPTGMSLIRTPTGMSLIRTPTGMSLTRTPGPCVVCAVCENPAQLTDF